jgi:prepilin-type N-terminal cleavage/methylation domain-containing protein
MTKRTKVMLSSRKRAGNRQEGMTLVELLIAMLVLAVGLSGVMTMVVAALASNGRNRTDTTATLISQMVIEQMANIPANQAAAAFNITDCAGNVFAVNLAQGGAALRGANNAPFWVASDIDFTAASPGAGYSMLYVSCGINAGQAVIYDVRWNITSTNGGTTKTVTVATRAAGTTTNLRYFSIPVQLKTILGA